MVWTRKRRFVVSILGMAVAWACICYQQIEVMQAVPNRFWGDGAGLVAAIIFGALGLFIVRDTDFPAGARRTLSIGWLFFFINALSDFLDEFLFPEGNPLLGKHQPLHRTLEIALWTGGFVLAIYGLAQIALDNINARRDVRREREKGEEHTRQSRLTETRLAQFVQAVEQAQEAFVLMDLDAIVFYANRAFHEILRLAPGEAFGQDATTLNVRDTRSPRVILDHVRAQGSWAGEVEVMRADGTMFYASATMDLFRDSDGAPTGIIGIARDTSERRALEAALRVSEERYRLIAEQATDLISTHTRDSHWLYVSPSVEHILGYKPEELLGRPAYDLMDPSQADALDGLDPSDFLDPQPRSIPVAMRHKDGHLVHLESRVRTLAPDTTDPNPRILAMSRDVTARLREEEERRQLELKLASAQRHESLALLAGGIAHDFNNLLLVVLANADLVRSVLGRDSEVESYVSSIQTASERAGELTRQMLTYAGRGEPDIRPANLNKKVREMASLLSSSVSKRIQLITMLDDELPLVQGDPTELRQVVMNLITNAAEAIGPHEGRIVVRTGSVFCTKADLAACATHDPLPEGVYAYVEVEDSGVGMDPRTAQRIFEPFFTTKFTGRGLGLATVLGIVRRHGGTIAIKSREGHGTTMRALFPTTSSKPHDQ